MSEKISSAGFSNLGGSSPDPGSRAEAGLATLLESVECGILLFGTGGELWAVNDRFAEIFGVEAEGLRELSSLEQIVERVTPQFADCDGVAARWRQRFRSGEAFWDELELAKPKKKIVERYAALYSAVINSRSDGWKCSRISLSVAKSNRAYFITNGLRPLDR
jgi:PAS domain S-box-containing protein